MNYKIRFLFLLIAISAYGAEKKKYNLSICALFKNESKHLKEWIEYHRLVGVDHFYLYENGSKDRYLKVLRPYLNARLVTLLPWPDRTEKTMDENLLHWALSTQTVAFENAIHVYAKKETNWLVFLDIDEFLVPVGGDNFTTLLNRYEGASGIALSSEFFDASISSAASVRNLVIESLDITKPPSYNEQECVRKIIFKPEKAVAFHWPPYEVAFQNAEELAQATRSEIRVHRYVNRGKCQPSFRKKMTVNQARLSESEVREILDSGYDLEDQEKVMGRFVPALVKQMGLP